MAELPHEEEAGKLGEEASAVAHPQALIDQARGLKESADALNSLLGALQTTHQAHTASISSLAELLSSAPTSAAFPESVSQVLAKVEGAMAQSAQLLADAQAGPLHQARAGRLEEFLTQADAFKRDKQAHEVAQANLSKLQSGRKPNQSKLRALTTEESDARRTMEAAAAAATTGGKTAEAEHASTMRRVVREAAFSQLMLHARGLELFTECMSTLQQADP